jgi:nucleoside-diphosphate-sugar epimerase
MTTLVTGATGFIGKALCQRLLQEGREVRAAVRVPADMNTLETVVVGDLTHNTDWSVALKNVECIVHLAARVHVMHEQSSDPINEFSKVNVEATVNLALQAAAAGVTRFVFVSSIKVNGESTKRGRPFIADDEPRPEDPYAISKFKAEQSLRRIAEQTGMEVVILRPPLVYGPGVKANFEMMMRWLERGIPLPFAAIRENRRSLVALDNFIDLIVTCMDHPAAAHQIFLVSDDEDLSTAELLERISAALGKPSRLFSFPPSLIKHTAALVNRLDVYQRLCGSLQVDISKTKELLEWSPPISVDESLRRTLKIELHSNEKTV